MGARVLFIWSFVLLYSQKIGGDFTVRSFHSRDLACLDYPNISAPIGRNICFRKCILCLLFPNCIRVLFPKKVLLLRFPFPCTYPIPLGLKTKEEPKMNQGTPKELPTTQKCFLLRLATSKKSLLR
mgnify:CR=1